MGKTRAECSQNAYTSHASAFLSHWIHILANSLPKSDIKKKKKKKKKKTTLFFRILRSRSGEGKHNNFFFGLILLHVLPLTLQGPTCRKDYLTRGADKPPPPKKKKGGGKKQECRSAENKDDPHIKITAFFSTLYSQF